MDKDGSIERRQSMSSVQRRSTRARQIMPKMPLPLVQVKTEPLEGNSISAEQLFQHHANKEPCLDTNAVAIGNIFAPIGQVQAGNTVEPMAQDQEIAANAGEPIEQAQSIGVNVAEQFEMVQRIAARIAANQEAASPTMSFEDMAWVIKESIKTLKFLADQLQSAMDSYLRGLTRVWHSSPSI